MGRGLPHGRFAVELRNQFALRFADFAELLVHVGGETDLAPLVPDGALDGLPDPPRRVRREAVAPLRVDLVYRFHQPDVALLDKVFEGKTLAAVLLGHRDG